MDIWSWFRRRPRAAAIPARNQIAQALAERRYDLADRLRQTLPARSELRDIFALQLLIAQSRYEEAAALYESARRNVRAQHSARVRYLRALSAMKRKTDLAKTLKVIFASRAEAENLASLLPYMRDFEPQMRADAARRIMTAGQPLTLDAQLACAQSLLEAEDRDGAVAIGAAVPHATPRENAEVAILHTNIALHDGDDAAATRCLSQAFEAFGLEPVSRRHADALLDVGNLAAQAPPAAAALGKASILMSCFNAEQSIGAALASLQAQSHPDIEIVVVDDCSTDGTAAIVEAVAASDPRVKLVPLAANRGAYYARNTALSLASGEFVLTHDADDWAHPRKVERLVRHLSANAELIAVRGNWIRFAAGAGVGHRGAYIRLDASSLTFRRQPVLERAGYFDTARIGADSEYAYRLQRLFGERSVGELDEMLSVAARTADSLSGAAKTQIDIDTVVYAPLRAAYRRAFFAWHEHADDLYLDFPQAEARPFPIPPELRP
ncbi:MAG TPA: glycosyltransferase family A protein [Rhizomicrobium sp.]